jgi:hypothetical protein
MAKKEDPKKAAEDIDDSFSSLRDTLRSISEELGINVNKITEAKKEYRGLLDVARQLQDNEEEVAKLSDKQVKTLRSKSEASLRELKIVAQKLAKEKGIDDISKVNLRTKKGLSDSQRTLLTMLQENFSVEEQIVGQLQEEDKVRDNINKKTGILGGILKGISKIPVLGNVFDAEQALDASKKSIRETKSAVSGLGGAFKNIGSQLLGGVLNPANLVLGAFTAIFDAVMAVDKATGDFAKSMNVSYEEALQTREELDAIAKASGDSALSGRRLQESLLAVNDALGTSGTLATADLETFTKLREQAGMTNEEIIDMQKYSMATGGSLEDNVESFQASAKALTYSKGVALNTKKIMADMSKVSNRTKISIEGGAAGLAKAAVAAKLMGGDLNKVAGIADNILDFEQSIENELSAQLLTGKNINLEQARQYALNNDMAGLAEEITKQAGSLEEYQHMNRIQQEAMAKAVGMTADELADVLVEQEALKSVGHALNEEEQRAYDAAVEKFGMDKAAKMLKDGELEKMVEQQSQQDRINQQIEKMMTLFTDMAPAILGLLEPLVEIANVVLPAISYILEPIKLAFQGIAGLISGNLEGLSTTQIVLGSIAAAVMGIVSVYKIYSAIQTGLNAKKKLAMMLEKQDKALSVGGAIVAIIKGAWSSLGIIPFVGAGLAVAAIAGGIGALMSQKGDDIMSPGGSGGGYGKRTLFGPEGAIQLNDKDTVIAGTNLFGNDVKSEPNKPTQMGGAGAIKVQSAGGGDMAAVISAINSLANRPINVSIDGKKVIEATTGAQPNTTGDESRKNSYKMS